MSSTISKAIPETVTLESDLFQILSATGETVGQIPNVSDRTLLDLFRHMIRTRTFNDRAMHLQRTGRIPYYYACTGQEAHVAIPLAMEDRDWIFCAYREQGVRLARGVPELNELALFAGKPYASWNPNDYRITPINATIGTHIPHATGYGYGNRLLGRDEVSLAIFGDGATSEVDFHAGLNNAGVWKTPTVFYCQNNLYAQSTPLAEQTASQTLAQKAQAYGFPGVRVDGMDVLAVYETVRQAVDRARAGKGPTLIEAVCYRFTSHSTYDGVPGYRTREEEAAWLEKDPIIRFRNFLLERGLLGETFEADAKEQAEQAIDAAMDRLDSMTPPSRQELFGSMYTRMPARLAEQLNVEQAAAGEAVTKLATDDLQQPGLEIEPTGETKAMTLVEALNAALHRGMETQPNMVILGEDVGREGGVFRVTADLYEKYGNERMLDTPLCELGIVGSAVGMAMAGVKPVCEIEFAGFTLTAVDQIMFHVARYHWRSNKAFNMPLVIRMPTAGGHEGLEGHSDSPEALFAHAPGLTVVYPSNPRDAKGLLAAALEYEDPVIFFEPVAQYFVRQKDVPVDHYTIPIGKAKVVQEGTDATIVTYGNTVGIAQKAAKTLGEDSVSVEVIDLRTLKPWDEQTVLDSVAKTGRLVVVHEATLSGGIGAEIVATVCEKAADLLETPPVRVAHADMIWNVAKLEPYSMISPQRVATAVRDVLEN